MRTWNSEAAVDARQQAQRRKEVINVRMSANHSLLSNWPNGCGHKLQSNVPAIYQVAPSALAQITYEVEMARDEIARRLNWTLIKSRLAIAPRGNED